MHKAEGNAALDVVVFADESLSGSEEFALGMRELRKRLPAARRWYAYGYGYGTRDSAPGAADFPAWSDAPLVLVILNPAIIASDNLAAELTAGIAAGDRNVACVLPGDLRAPYAAPDYASRPGFDRYVAGLKAGARWADYDRRSPWVYLVTRDALEDLAQSHREMSWSDVPPLLGSRTVVARHAFVHSYADYCLNDRADMLRLLPAGTRTLLDVGGGEGNFARVFMAQRGGRATLLEANPGAAAAARSRGLDVLAGDFESVAASAQYQYDCVAFLEVLEHLVDPLAALLKARQIIAPGGSLLLSVPNVGHWSVVWDLLQGEFDYQPVGILCTTHLRFFTRRSLQRLLGDARFTVERWEDVPSPPPAAFAALLDACPQGFAIDRASLAVESFHVLARRD